MKNFILTIMAVLTIGLVACAQKTDKSSAAQEGAKSKTLVTYYSATGTTKDVAEQLAKYLGADVHEIAPEKIYTDADLDWHDKQSRSSVEMADEKSRPALKEQKTDLAAYDTIFIGFPVWWDLAPRVVNTFIESNDLAGKVVIPFATSGGSSIKNSEKDLKRLYPNLNWQPGRLVNDPSPVVFKSWLGK